MIGEKRKRKTLKRNKKRKSVLYGLPLKNCLASIGIYGSETQIGEF